MEKVDMQDEYFFYHAEYQGDDPTGLFPL